jgi:hypothetical protein
MRASERKGAVVVLAAFLMVAMLGLVAFAIDSGVICTARTELQRSADSAALAATTELMQSVMAGEASSTKRDRRVAEVARQFVELNHVCQKVATIDVDSRRGDPDFSFGEVRDWESGQRSFNTAAPDRYNSVQVRVARCERINGEVPLFFAGIVGRKTTQVEARATAAFITGFRGFRTPLMNGKPQNLPLLPIALSEASLNEMLAGDGPDSFSWEGEDTQVSSGADGRHEVDLFPERAGASGNWGLLDLGGAQSSPSTLQKQIRNGLTPAEMAYHGGELSLDYQGELTLSGNTGLKTGVIESALQSIVGEPRIAPIYRSASGAGTNAEYTIVGFAGVCVVEVHLKSGVKYLRIQTCPVITRGGIASDGSQQTSTYIYSPVALVN